MVLVAGRRPARPVAWRTPTPDTAGVERRWLEKDLRADGGDPLPPPPLLSSESRSRPEGPEDPNLSNPSPLWRAPRRRNLG